LGGKKQTSQELLVIKGLPPLGDYEKKPPDMRFLLIALSTLCH